MRGKRSYIGWEGMIISHIKEFWASSVESGNMTNDSNKKEQTANSGRAEHQKHEEDSEKEEDASKRIQKNNPSRMTRNKRLTRQRL